MIPLLKFVLLPARKGNIRHSGGYFRYSLTLSLLVSCIPGLMIGIGIYGTVTGRMENDLQRMHQSQIAQRAQYVDDELAALESTFAHWAFDPAFDKPLQNLDVVEHYEQVRGLSRTLLVFGSSHPLIGKTELYLRKPQPFVMNAERYTLLTGGDSTKPYEKWLSFRQWTFWTQEMPDAAGKTDDGGPISLVNRLPGLSGDPLGLLVATLDRAKLADLLQTMTPYSGGVTFLLTEEGGWVATGGSGDTALEQTLREEALRKGGLPGAFLFTFKNRTYSVYIGQWKRLGTAWTYVSAAPLTAITAPVLSLSKAIVAISGGGLLLALLLSWMGSVRLYSPWKKMTHESETLRDRLERQLPLVRESFLLQLAQGRLLPLSDAEVRERFAQLGWELDGERFAAMSLQLRRSAGSGRGMAARDEEMLAFASLELVKELRADWHPIRVEAFHDGGLSVALLLLIPECYEEAFARAELRRIGTELIDSANRILNVKATLSISKTVSSADRIHLIFEEARQAFGFRPVKEHSPLIDMDQLDQSDWPREFRYPFALEKEVVHAVRAGLEEEAVANAQRFMEELSGGGSTELTVQYGMLQLLGSVQHAMLELGVNPVRLSGGANLFAELSRLKEAEEMLAWFHTRVIQVSIEEINSRNQGLFKLTVEQLLSYLRENYMLDISLDELAEKASVSTYTLSRAFKETLGVNFIEYLTQIRLERAKELLVESDMKINGIAEKVGYQPSYFNRIFKKAVGMTPNQYRNLRNRGQIASAPQENREREGRELSCERPTSSFCDGPAAWGLYRQV